MARNAKDNMVSFFHMDRMTLVHPDPGDWNSYFHRFMQGKSMYRTTFHLCPGAEQHVLEALLVSLFVNSPVWILV